MIASVQQAACTINVTMKIISLCGTVPRNVLTYVAHTL